MAGLFLLVTAGACLGLEGPVTVSGVLTLAHVPGPPNYADIAKGDADELVFLLTLAQPLCLSDGADGFADPRVPVRTVQLVPAVPATAAALKALLGRGITVTGAGQAAENARHRAPLVVTVSEPPKPD